MTPKTSTRTGWRRSGSVFLLSMIGLGPEQAHAEPTSLVWPHIISATIQTLEDPTGKGNEGALVNLKKVAPSVLLRWLPRLLGSADSQVRLAAARICWRLRPEAICSGLAEWLANPDGAIRRGAAEAMSLIADPSARSALTRALSDPDDGVREFAAVALGNMGGAQGVQPLVALLSDPNTHVRAASLSALALLADPKSVVPVAGRLRDEEPGIRRAAAATLANLRDVRAVPPLVSTLRDPEPSVGHEAARSLGQLEFTDAVTALLSELTSTRDPLMRRWTARALGQIGGQASIEGLIRALAFPNVEARWIKAALASTGQAALPFLESCIRNKSRLHSSQVCLEAAGQIPSPGTTPLLLKALATGWGSKEAALEGLGRVGDPSATPIVLQYVTHELPSLRRSGLDALQGLLGRSSGGGMAVEPLLEAIHQAKGLHEQRRLVETLGLTRSSRALAPLVKYTRSTDRTIQRIAFEAIGNLNSINADLSLLRGLKSRFPEIRRAAAIALRRTGGSESLTALLTSFSHRTSSKTAALAISGPLSRDDDEKSLRQVLAQLDRSRGEIRDILIGAVGTVNRRAASDALVARLATSDAASRAKIAEVLGAHSEALATVRELTQDRSAQVRANAIWSLGLLANKSDVPMLLASLEDTDWNVASNAAAALGQFAARSQTNFNSRLCPLLNDPRGHVVANALTALSFGTAPCSGQRVLWLLHHHPSPVVRTAAARLLQRRETTPTQAHALRRCAAQEPLGEIGQLCATQFSLGSMTSDGHSGRIDSFRSVQVVPTYSGDNAANHSYALQSPNGWLRNGATDRAGYVLVVSVETSERYKLVTPTVYAP